MISDAVPGAKQRRKGNALKTLISFSFTSPVGTVDFRCELYQADEANPPQYVVKREDPAYDDPLEEVFQEWEDAVDVLGMVLNRQIYERRGQVAALLKADPAVSP